jgi:hypothetical protein
VDRVFGSRGAYPDKGTRIRGEHRHRLSDAQAQTLGLGALGADDCFATGGVTEDARRRITRAGDEADLRRALDGAGVSDWQQAFHVAIDRWTGGAAESLLYTALEPFRVGWEPIRLTIDLARLPDYLDRDAGLALVHLVLRDLAAGRLPLGFATNRGMGTVRVTRVALRPHDLGDPWPAGEIVLPGGDPKHLSDGRRRAINAAWTAWLKEEA